MGVFVRCSSAAPLNSYLSTWYGTVLALLSPDRRGVKLPWEVRQKFEKCPLLLAPSVITR